MAGWHSLSGYLYFKPTGPFSLFKQKKKQWYIFEESKSQLLYYRSQQDANSKEPLGAIDIQGACISLNLEENNEFIICSDSKEYILQAENHESMMIWLLGLQAKRDASSSGQGHKTDDSPSKKLNRRRVSDPAVVHRAPPEVQLTRAASAKIRRSSVKVNGYSKSGSTGSTGGLPCDTSRSLPTWSLTRLQTPLTGSSLDKSSIVEEDEDVISCHCVPATIEEFNTMRRSTSSSAIGPLQPPNPNFTDMKLTLSQSFTTGVGPQASKKHSRKIPNRIVSSISDEEEPEDGEDEEEDGVEDVFNYDMLIDRPGGVTGSADGCITPTMTSSQSKMATRVPPPVVEENSPDTLHSSQSTSLDSGVPKEDRSNGSFSDDSVIDKDMDPAVKILELEKELLGLKRDLAQAFNRETCLQEMLAKRERTIVELDEKATRLEQIERVLQDKDKDFSKVTDKNAVEALTRTTAQLKELQETCRVLQNQNCFLNEEVKKLSSIRQSEHETFRTQNHQIRALEMEIERWKRDYIFLLQSNITVPTGDVTDGFELNLYGGDRHKERLQELLEEARRKNPGLPTFEKLTQSNHHVDRYGFKHTHENDSFLLHYICRQLHEHYTQQLARHEQHQVNWKNYLRKSRSVLQKSKELKQLCRAGIPAQYRCEVWRMLVHDRVKQIRQIRGQHYYTNICNLIHESEVAGNHRKQISLDLLRTLPTNVHFDQNEADGIKKLQEVLQAFVIHNPEIGYCQGMNFIAGMALLFLDKEDAFWCLVALTTEYFPEHYFNSNLIGAQTDQLVLKDLVIEYLPKLHKHLTDIDIDISTITLNWFLAVFFDAVPFETLVRIWDCFLLEGPKVLFRFAVAILKIHERVLLQQSDTISIWKHLKLAAKLTFDVEGLTKVAFEDLSPFAKRRDIAQKQADCMLSLREREKNREIKRKAFDETELKFQEMDKINSDKAVIECLTCYQDGKLWLCHGDQNSAKVCLINCESNLMHELSCEFDSRILCICTLSEDIVILGSLAMNLYSFNTNTKEKLWQVRLHDSIMDLCVCFGEDRRQNKVFAALADGTIAVLENVNDNEPMGNIFYIPIGFSPVTSLLLVNQELWCACSSTVQILQASTLDQRDRFRVSTNPFDHILVLRQGLHGVWIAVKGSSIVELWDENTLTCRLLYDVKENRYPRTKRDDDNVFNPHRITSLMPYHNSIWIGSGSGDVTVYEISERPGMICRPFLRSSSLNASLRSQYRTGLSQTAEDMRLLKARAINAQFPDDDDATPKVTPHASPLRRIEKTSRTTQTASSQIQRTVVLNKKKAVEDDTKGKIFQMDLDERTNEGLHLEIFIKMQDEENPPSMEDKSTSVDLPVLCQLESSSDQLQQSTTSNNSDIKSLAMTLDNSNELDTASSMVEISGDDSAVGGAMTELDNPEEIIEICIQEVDDDEKHADSMATTGDGVAGRCLSPISEKSSENRNTSTMSSKTVNSQDLPNQASPIQEDQYCTSSPIPTPVIPVAGNTNLSDKTAATSISTDSNLLPSSASELGSPISVEGEDEEATSDMFSSCEESSVDSMSHRETESYPNRKGKPLTMGNYQKDDSLMEDDEEDENMLYDLGLQLVVRNKVAETPIRCLAQTLCNSEVVIVSCGSSYEEDESVLKWRRESTEQSIWTNEPIFKMCQETKTVKLPAYMKHRLSFSTTN